MTGPETWIQALSRASAPAQFTLDFARLGLQARCRSLSAPEISAAMALSGEAAPRQLLYLACPSLQQAGEALVQQGTLARPQDILLELPYSDVLQAASMILQHSGAGAGMVRMISGDPAATPLEADTPLSPETGMDGYALLRQWAAEDRSAFAAGQTGTSLPEADAFAATRSLRRSWAAEHRSARDGEEATTSPAAPAQNGAAFTAVTAEQVAEVLCQRLCDAAGNL